MLRRDIAELYRTSYYIPSYYLPYLSTVRFRLLKHSILQSSYTTIPLSTMPQPPLRIAILECDTPLQNTNSKYGGYGGVFTSLLHRGASSLSPPLGPLPESSLQITKYDVVTAQEYPDLSSIDAILISGSRHTSFDNDPWILKLVDFVKSILEQERVKVIGVCFGHQIVGRAMGMRVDRSDRGWEVSVTPVELTSKGKELFGLESLVRSTILFYFILFY